MYALLFPSAQRFISSVEEKVNVELRQMLRPTDVPTPCRSGSPAWTALVCGPDFCPPCLCEGLCNGLFFMLQSILEWICAPASTNLAQSGKRILRRDACHRRSFRRAARRRTQGLDLFFNGLFAVGRFVCPDHFFPQFVGHVVLVREFHVGT